MLVRAKPCFGTSKVPLFHDAQIHLNCFSYHTFSCRTTFIYRAGLNTVKLVKIEPVHKENFLWSFRKQCLKNILKRTDKNLCKT